MPLTEAQKKKILVEEMRKREEEEYRKEVQKQMGREEKPLRNRLILLIVFLLLLPSVTMASEPLFKDEMIALGISYNGLRIENDLPYCGFLTLQKGFSVNYDPLTSEISISCGYYEDEAIEFNYHSVHVNGIIVGNVIIGGYTDNGEFSDDKEGTVINTLNSVFDHSGIILTNINVGVGKNIWVAVNTKTNKVYAIDGSNYYTGVLNPTDKTVSFKTSYWLYPNLKMELVTIVYTIYPSGVIEENYNATKSSYTLTDEQTNKWKKFLAGDQDFWSFKDVSMFNPRFDAIKYLRDTKAIQGYSDGTFRPDQKVNRAELLKLLLSGQNISPDAGQYKNCFPDVKEEWFAPYICYAKEKGLVSGYPNGTFKPSNIVNKAETLKILTNVLELSDSGNTDVTTIPYKDIDYQAWYASYLAKAHNWGILDETGDSYSPATGMDRGTIAENLFRLIIVKNEGLPNFTNDAQDAFLNTYYKLPNTNSNINTNTNTNTNVNINLNSNSTLSSQSSSSDRPIGTVQFMDGNDYMKDVWEIITTNDVVKGFRSSIDERTGIMSSYHEGIEYGIFNKTTGLIHVEYSFFYYPNIQEDLVTVQRDFKIQGNKVIDKDGLEIGTFTPDKLTFTKVSQIPKTQGCTDFWGNGSDKIYYYKGSVYYNEKTNDSKYNYNVVFFCNEQDALNQGYTKSLK